MEMAEKASGKRPQTIGIVMDNTAASVAFVKPMRDHQLAKLGLKLVVDETFTPPLANATPLIQKVRSARPDILILLPTAISDAKLLLEKMNEFGLGRGKLPTISNGAAILDPDLRNNMNIEQLEGVMAVVANWTTSAQKEFVAEVKKKTSEPWPTQHFVTTYGDILIFKAALEAAGKADREAVAKALHAMNLTGGRRDFLPRQRQAEVRRQRPARRREPADRAVAEGRADHRLSGQGCDRAAALAQAKHPSPTGHEAESELASIHGRLVSSLTKF